MDQDVCESPCTDEKAAVHAGLLSQAVTGELVGMLNYAGMIDLCTDMAEKEEAVEHAESERRHAAVFRSCAQELGLEIIEDVNAPYWRRVRGAFLAWAGRQDRIACILLQGVMLESFAAALYQAVGEAVEGKMAQLFRRIAKEEELHVEDSTRVLRKEYQKNTGALTEKARRVHESDLPILI